MGDWSESTPMLNQVERSPSPASAVAPATGAVTVAPRERDVIVTVFARREGLRLTVASRTRPATRKAWPSVLPVTGTGPQSWYGEILSYGSLTDTRYGRPGGPKASAADCVWPPVLDEKSVSATLSL